MDEEINVINVGDMVRSYDFDRRKDCYIEGEVVGIREQWGAMRYQIRAHRRIFAGNKAPCEMFYYPPVNGLVCAMNHSGKTNGVVKL